MNREKNIDSAVSLGRQGLLFVASTSSEGIPHMAAANSISKAGAGQIAVTDWFCPGTVANCTPGRPVSVVVWEQAGDKGHQLVGRVAMLEDTAMMDGYLPGEKPQPQVERRLVVDVDTILAFSRGPHSDVEEG